MTDNPKLRIPAPDPLGILETITDGTFFDPIAHALAHAADSRHAAETARVDVSRVPPDLLPDDMKIDKYMDLLKQAHRVAPCKGCKGLVESALTGAMVYKKMQESGLTAEDIRKEPGTIDMIKKQVQDMVSQG